jgi:antitoxin CcdA
MRMIRYARASPARKESPRKAANLSIDAGLLAAARRFEINLSATLESALIAELRQRKRREWKAVHAAAIAEYNERVEKTGVFSDGLRKF